MIPVVILSILLVAISLDGAYTRLSKEVSDPITISEIEEIIEDAIKKAEGKAAEGQSKVAKDTPEIKTFITSYFTFPGTFTANLMGSRKFLQVGVGISTQSDEEIKNDEVIKNLESHQLAIRTEILSVMSDFSESDIQGSLGRKKLAGAIRDRINVTLVSLENMGGVDDVFFTSFVLQ